MGFHRYQDHHDKSRTSLDPAAIPYLLHQTPLRSESRKSVLDARFGPLLSALSGKRAHREIVECYAIEQ